MVDLFVTHINYIMHSAHYNEQFEQSIDLIIYMGEQ